MSDQSPDTNLEFEKLKIEREKLELEKKKIDLEERKLALEQGEKLTIDKTGQLQDADEPSLELKKLALEQRKNLTIDTDGKLKDDDELALELKKLALEQRKNLTIGIDGKLKEHSTFWTGLLEYLKVLISWPVVVIVFILFNTGSINKLTERIVNESTSLNIAGAIEVELEKQARIIGDEELVSALNGISQLSLEILVRIPSADTRMRFISFSQRGDEVVYRTPSEDVFNALIELEQAGLIESPRSISDYKEFLDNIDWEPSLDPLDDRRQSFTRDEHLPEEIEAEMDDIYYELTERGELAAQAVLNTFVSLLNE